ncbi:MAG TPA: acetoin utilization protein acuB [Flavobacteriaceae bacterium]|nr:acetoin utilization protein acuB [Flavobacteriaceae bacterium]MCB9212318.1 acetoin utilization protein acuB [Alteromonas sp.]HPF12475.1 acetoin utilization protein acuB [Flavobacteriaceae bacterium]HQU22266.1 acetoin utilization protein acuB [Flavobacteriaceae bacterium]HQU65201.1 acetoin utilization protein acuB [Flavobacteriaceae bacterium]
MKNIQEYIINDIRPFEVSEKMGVVKNAFSQLTYSHVPISKKGVYAGCISETDAHCFDSNKTLEDYLYAIEPFFVKQSTNWLDVIEAFALKSSNIMPVLGSQNEYLGYYELGDIMDIFNHTPFLSEAGGIIVVEKGSHDYSFSEICQIVESNDGKLLGVFVSHIENDVTQATIKIGHSGMGAITQTFRRYGYNVVSEHEEDKLQEELKERSDYLNKYLNI